MFRRSLNYFLVVNTELAERFEVATAVVEKEACLSEDGRGKPDGEAKSGLHGDGGREIRERIGERRGAGFSCGGGAPLLAPGLTALG